jgi:hypothetical protein
MERWETSLLELTRELMMVARRGWQHEHSNRQAAHSQRHARSAAYRAGCNHGYLFKRSKFTPKIPLLPVGMRNLICHPERNEGVAAKPMMAGLSSDATRSLIRNG